MEPREAPRSGSKVFDSWKLRKRVEAAEDRLSTAESTLKKLEMEWSDTYDRLRRTMSRVVKRAEREAVDAAADPLTPENSAPVSGGLSPRQRLIQDQIMRRRGNGGDNGLLPR
jgi:hypothetical protein